MTVGYFWLVERPEISDLVGDDGSLRWSLDPDDLGFADAGLNDIAYALAERRSRQWRDMRDRALGRIGFVLTDDPERLLPAIVAQDCY